MLQRSRKVNPQKQQYYIVIGAFVGVCVLSVLYVLLNPKKSFASMPVIDESAILVHNGQQSNAFQRGENTFFQVSRVSSWLLQIDISDYSLHDSHQMLDIELDHLKREEPLWQLSCRHP